MSTDLAGHNPGVRRSRHAGRRRGFPVLTASGHDLGRTPSEIPKGAYYMNPEELPFEGEASGTDGSVFYAGSGRGTGFKLGPGVAWLAVERLMGVPREDWLIASPSLERRERRVPLPLSTRREELLRLFRPVSEGGRLIEIGAGGIGPGAPC